MGHGPGKNLSHFSANLNPGADPEIVTHLLTLGDFSRYSICQLKKQNKK